jgi:hypothetical protein
MVKLLILGLYGYHDGEFPLTNPKILCFLETFG